MELFVLVGTFIEEVISPIPSFIVLIPAGAGAHTQDEGLGYLAILAALSGLGRIAGASILYWVADKFEDLLLSKGRRFFGISHKEVEQFGQRLGRGRKRDWVMLFVMNALPLFPGAALSLTCGFIKVRYPMFLLCTFFGTMINAVLYLSIGYSGIAVLDTIKSIEAVAQIVTAIALGALLIWYFRRRMRAKSQKVDIS